MSDEQAVVLACPGCGHEWVAAHIQDGAWWSSPPAAIAKQCHCVLCHHVPPMRVVRVTLIDTETQGSLDFRGEGTRT